MMSSGATMDLPVIGSIVVVFLRDPWRLSLSIVALVMKFIAAPKSMRVLGTIIFLIFTSTLGLP